MFITKEEFDKLQEKAERFDHLDNAYTELHYAYNQLYGDNLNLNVKLTDQKRRSSKAYRELEKKYMGVKNGLNNERDALLKLRRDYMKAKAENERLMNSVKRQTGYAEEWRKQCGEAQDSVVTLSRDFELMKQRCKWYSDKLRRENELNRQLTDELENKAKFICKPFLKEHEEMKEDLEGLATSVVALNCSASSDSAKVEGLWRLYAKSHELLRKWF